MTLRLLSRSRFAVRSVRRAPAILTAVLSLSMLSACSLSDLVSNTALPPSLTDPAIAKTAAGAFASYQGALLTFSNVLGGKFVSATTTTTTSAGDDPSYMYVVGLLTDELSLVPDASNAPGGFPTTGLAAVDNRSAPENDPTPNGISRISAYQTLYGQLQSIRAHSREARGMLVAYTADSTSALIGHMYAMEGYADVLLAELFCSGIPLSTVDPNGDFVLTRGFTSEEVYQHAVALFDSALTLAADSANIVSFATMGRARARLDLGDYAGAAQDAATVSTSYQYLLRYASTRPNYFLASLSTGNTWPGNESNREGTNGLQYWGDPRTDTVRTFASSPSTFRYIPRRWLQAGATPNTAGSWVNNGLAPLPIATGIEARLIEAEAAYHSGGDWLGMLNALRTSGFTLKDTVVGTLPDTMTVQDTLWNAGSGGFAGLPPLTDPGTDSGRVSLIFSERAHWLFLTGYRQGDLRRLVRQYNRPEETVYPVGPWGPTPPVAVYGTDTNAPVPLQEQQTNPQYGGCVNRDA